MVTRLLHLTKPEPDMMLRSVSEHQIRLTESRGDQWGDCARFWTCDNLIKKISMLVETPTLPHNTLFTQLRRWTGTRSEGQTILEIRSEECSEKVNQWLGNIAEYEIVRQHIGRMGATYLLRHGWRSSGSGWRRRRRQRRREKIIDGVPEAEDPTLSAAYK
jgi:hypothetical protein